MKMDKATVIRTIILIIALTNQFLVSFDKSPLPIDDGLVETIVSSVFTAVTVIWTWFKNNYVTKKGQKQKEVLKRNGLA